MPDLVVEPAPLLMLITSLLEEDRVDMIILDGALSWLIRKVYFKMDEYPHVVLITCTSFQALGKISQEVSFMSAPRARFVMDSWTEMEYEGAVEKGVFSLPQGTKVGELFYYAGGSIRLFLQPVEDVINDLESKIERVPDMGKLVGSGGVGDASEYAVNSLMAIYDKKSIVLSQFVLRKLLDSVSDDFIRKARLFLPGNAAWQGWVTEAEVLHMARTQRSMTFRNNPNDAKSVETWHPSSYGIVSFASVSDKALRSQHVGWYQPTRWYEKGFDALFLASTHELRVVQITDASKRKFDLKVVIPLAQAMKTQVIVIVHVCRKRNFKFFKLIKSEEGDSPMALEDVLQTIFDAKVAATGRKMGGKEMLREGSDDELCPEPSITFRTICYELDEE
jgi:hypothetical protein